MVFSVLVGAAMAQYETSLPADMEVMHVHIIFRHGQRSRLVKTLASEFGENAGVTVRTIREGYVWWEFVGGIRR